MATQDISRVLKDLADRYPEYEFLAKKKPTEYECNHMFQKPVFECVDCWKTFEDITDKVSIPWWTRVHIQQPPVKIQKLELWRGYTEPSNCELMGKINEIIDFINNM